MAIKQQSRLLGIDTALGKDVVAARSVSIKEQLGRLSQIEAELSSEDGEIDFNKVVGRPATVRLQIGQDATRYFNGVVSRFVQVANKGGYAHYQATLVPWLWLLTRTSDCRIFQDKTAPEIIEAVFQGHGFSDYQLKLSGTYVKREYCVQYRETDFNFVSRLMEEEGLYYFFLHEASKHTLVLADSASAHTPFEGYEEILFHVLEKGATGRQTITDWTVEHEVQPVAYALKDFDFKKPKAQLYSPTNVTREHGAAQFEIYDYPGEYVENTEGDRLAQVRLDELQAQHETVRGLANARGLAAGSTFTLKEHPRKDQNREYLITSVTLRAEAGEYAAGASQPAGEFFECNFTVLDTEQPFRPSRLTPRPFVQGPQTAIVVGPKGEEIHTDEHGRVKLQFHWDRYGKADENSSCWVRVAQSWAGKNWGAVFTPRIGQEVIVDFLEGDPDRPIITGRVYNEESKPPYELPAEKTKSAIKTLSSKGGGGFNEIRFEDKKGEEQLFIHGQRNVDLRNGKDRFDTVGNDHHTNIAANSSHSIGADSNLSIGGAWKISTGSDQNLTVGGKSAVDISGSDSRNIGGAVIEKNGGDRHMTVAGTLNVSAPNIILTADSNITLKVGGSTIVIGAGGISVKTGADIAIDAGAKLDATAGAPAKLSGSTVDVTGQGPVKIAGATVDVNGSGPVTVKGAVVKVNS